MSDLVQRLRAAEYPSDWTGPRTEHEAADAIARLTHERDALFGKLAEVLDHE